MTKSRIFLYFCLSFVGGIFVSSLGFLPCSREFLLLPGLILGILLISALWRHKRIVVVGFCILFFAAGIWRHQTALLEIYYPKEENITFVGIVVSEPDIRSNNIKLTVKSDEKGSRRFGKILVTTNRYPEYRYGDKLKITGKLQVPQDLEDFNYKDYLAKDGIYSVMYWPKVELLEREKYPLFTHSPLFAHSTGATRAIYGIILDFKNKLRESIYQNLSPPQSSILGAMILGDKREMPSELKEKLNITGLRHITAVSGLHVAVLTSILMSVLTGLGLWKKQAFYFTIILIMVFIVMTGLQPSAIRAGIMGGLFLFAQYLGRPNLSSRAIVFAGTIMLAQNPLLLRLDVGFQLSFLAMMGIIYLLPTFQNWLKFIPWENPKSTLAMTFSAYFFTLPILIFNFGYISFIAPLTNILIVPLLYWIMIFGFIFGIVGIIFQSLGWIFSFPAWLLLTYLVEVVDKLSKIPWAYKTLENVHWIWPLISYLVLAVIAWQLNKKGRNFFWV